MKHEKLMTTAEVAAVLRLAVSKVRELVKQRELPAIRMGPRLLRFRPSAVERFLQRNTTEAEIHTGQTEV